MTSRRISYIECMIIRHQCCMYKGLIKALIYLLHWDKVVFDLVQQVDKVMKAMVHLETLVVVVGLEDLDDMLLLSVD